MFEAEVTLCEQGVVQAGYAFPGRRPVRRANNGADSARLDGQPLRADDADLPAAADAMPSEVASAAPSDEPSDALPDQPEAPPAPTKKNVGFINEMVSEKDIRKYELREISIDCGAGEVSYYWTIDRRRNIYLREVGPRDAKSSWWHFSFCWKDELLWFDLEVSAGGASGAEGYTVWSLGKGSKRKPLRLPDALEKHREAITSALKDALTAFRPAGLCSNTTVNVVQFDF